MKKIFLILLTYTLLTVSNLSFNASLVHAEETNPPVSVDFLEDELRPKYLPTITDPKISEIQEASNQGEDSQTATRKTERFFGDLIVTALQFLGGSIVLLIIIYALKMVFAFGNEEEITNSKKALGNLALGLLLIMLSYSITLFILDLTLIPQEIQEARSTQSTQESSAPAE